ncbi:MAG: hypothetical protein HQ595_03120 [Candidatus Omnitrophica bacterium]|nr:hypothetical protein [Candidatus Omnitrophota bacterium]
MLKNTKGIAMLIVVAMVLMLLALAGAALQLSVGHHGTSFHQITRTRAIYAAEAAIQQALWGCRTAATGYQNLDSIASGVPRVPSAFIVSYPNYTLTANIRIYARDGLPQGSAVPTPPGTYPIIVTVDY